MLPQKRQSTSQRSSMFRRWQSCDPPTRWRFFPRMVVVAIAAVVVSASAASTGTTDALVTSSTPRAEPSELRGKRRLEEGGGGDINSDIGLDEEGEVGRAYGRSERNEHLDDRGRDLRVFLVHDQDRNKKGLEERTYGEDEEGTEPAVVAVASNLTNIETEMVEVGLRPFSLSLSLDVPPASATAVETTRNGGNGGEDEDDPSSSDASLNRTVAIVETLTEDYLRDQLSVLLRPPSSKILVGVVLNVTSFDSLSADGDDADGGDGGVRMMMRNRRRALRLGALGDDGGRKDDEGKQAPQLEVVQTPTTPHPINVYFEGAARFAMPVPVPSNSSTDPIPAINGRVPKVQALRRAQRTALSGSRLNDPDDDGSLLYLLKSAGNDAAADPPDGDEDAVMTPVLLSGVTGVIAKLERAPYLRPSPPASPTGEESDADNIKEVKNEDAASDGEDNESPEGESPSISQGDEQEDSDAPQTGDEDVGDVPKEGDAAANDDANNATMDDLGADGEQPPQPSQEGVDAARGNSTSEEGSDAGPNMGDAGNSTGGANATATEGIKDGKEEAGETSGSITAVGENATVVGAIGQGTVEAEGISPPTPPPQDHLVVDKGGKNGGEIGSLMGEDQLANNGTGQGDSTGKMAGIIAAVVVTVAAAGGIALAFLGYRGRRRRMVWKRRSSPAGQGDDEDAKERTMQVDVKGNHYPKKGTKEEQRVGASFDTFDSEATGNSISVAAKPGTVVATSGVGGTGDHNVRGEKRKGAAYDFTNTITGLSSGLDLDLGGIGGGKKKSRCYVELDDEPGISLVDPLEEGDADATEESRQGDVSAELLKSDERKSDDDDDANATADNVVQKDHVNDDLFASFVNNSAGNRNFSSGEIKDGMSPVTPVAANGIQFEAAAAITRRTSSSDTAAEATKANAEQKEDDLPSTAKSPSTDASLEAKQEFSTPKNDPYSLGDNFNGDASNSSSRNTSSVPPSSSSSSSSSSSRLRSLPFKGMFRNASKDTPPCQEGTNAVAADNVSFPSQDVAKCGDDHPGDDSIQASNTKTDCTMEPSGAVHHSPSPLPPAVDPPELQQKQFTALETTGAVADESSRTSSASLSTNSDEVDSNEESSGRAASLLLKGKEQETDKKEKATEASDGGSSNEEKKTATAMKRTLSRLSPQRLVRITSKAKLLRKSSNSSSTEVLTSSSNDAKEGKCGPIDPSHKTYESNVNKDHHDGDSSSSGYVDSSVGDEPTTGKDCHHASHHHQHHADDSSFDDDSAYAFSEGSMAWSYDKVAHPSGLPRGSIASGNSASVTNGLDDAVSNPSKALRRSTPSLMVELSEFV